MKTPLIALALLILSLAAVLALAEHAPAQAPLFSRSDAVLASRACVHEATFAGETTGDCGGIIQTVQSRRRAGETFSHALERTMPRFAAHTTDRSWVHDLRAELTTGNPEGWPFRYSFHARRGPEGRSDAQRWNAVYLRVSRFMHGEEPLPCNPEPRAWYGRRTDGNVLAERLATGRWREAACGVTRNAFLYAVDPD